MSFDSLSPSRKNEIKRAFDTLTEPLHDSASPATSASVISEVGLPHMCRVLNLCVTEEDLYNICITYGKLKNGDTMGLPASSLLLLPPCQFHFDDVKRVYDALMPKQPSYVADYFQFFNLLDLHETGSVSQADLRHSLCTAGERLSDDEFNHLLYVNDLLHKPTISVFEFVRLLLRVKGDGAPL